MATRVGPTADTNSMQFALTSPSEPVPVLFMHTLSGAANSVRQLVADSGPGLAADVQARLFQPFHTTKPDGLGLGLAISRSIIAAHKGRIWASPRAGGGAEFHFTLPLVPQ